MSKPELLIISGAYIRDIWGAHVRGSQEAWASALMSSRPAVAPGLNPQALQALEQLRSSPGGCCLKT